MYNDLWASDVFGLVTMTDAINKAPYQPTEFEDNMIWAATPSYTTDVGLDIVQNRIQLLPLTPRGGQLPSAQNWSRTAAKIPIQRFGSEDSVLNDEVLGVRATGTLNLLMASQIRDNKLQNILDSTNYTTSLLMAAAIDGVVPDPLSGEVVLNIRQVLGLSGLGPLTVTWDFSSAALNPNEELGEMKRYIGDLLGAARFSARRFRLLCGRTFFRNFRNIPSVKSVWDNISGDIAVANVLVRLGQTDRQAPGIGFVFAENVEVIDVGDARGWYVHWTAAPGTAASLNGFIPDDEARLLADAPGLWRRVFGPSSLGEFQGNILPFYAAQKPREWNDGIDLRGETYQVMFCARPDHVIRIIGTNLQVYTGGVLPANPQGLGQ